MFEAHTLDRFGSTPDQFFENMGRSECVLDEVLSKCVVEAKAGTRVPNQVIVVK